MPADGQDNKDDIRKVDKFQKAFILNIMPIF